MDYVIGEKIRSVILQKGITFRSFADRFGMTDRNLQNFFKRNDISIDQLKRASEILEYNFINDYLANTKGGEKLLNIDSGNDAKPKDFTTMIFSLTICGLPSHFEKFPELLSVTKKTAERLGFKLA